MNQKCPKEAKKDPKVTKMIKNTPKVTKKCPKYPNATSAIQCRARPAKQVITCSKTFRPGLARCSFGEKWAFVIPLITGGNTINEVILKSGRSSTL